MTFTDIRHALGRTFSNLSRHDSLDTAAALSYYSILAIFPALIGLSALLAYIPLPDLFAYVLGSMQRVLPPDTMRLVDSVLPDILSSNRQAWLSLGMLTTLWVVSAAFDAAIDALDTAYGARKHRPFWKSRLIAIALSLVTGSLLVAALTVIILGPKVGGWIAIRLSLSWLFLFVWPFIHRTIAIAFTILAVAVVYFFGPNVKRSFLTTVPGAILSTGLWIGLSALLGIYFRHFSSYNRTYGTLGGFIAFMIWFYWVAFAFLVGAEFNVELAAERREIHPQRGRRAA